MNIKSTMIESPERRRMRWLLGLAAILAMASAFVWWPGCRRYPPVSSRENLELIKIVYTACNTRNPQRLQAARERIETAARAGQLSLAEEAGFRAILDTAVAGDWSAAEAAALRFARDQIGQGP